MDSGYPYEGDRYAVYQGHTYRSFADGLATMITLRLDEGDPVPEGVEPDPRGPSRCYLVGHRQVTAWYSTSWTFRWKGELFSSYGATGDRITGLYMGGKGSAFADAHLTRMGAHEYQGTFPLDQVTDLTEKRYDLLAAWQEKHPA